MCICQIRLHYIAQKTIELHLTVRCFKFQVGKVWCIRFFAGDCNKNPAQTFCLVRSPGMTIPGLQKTCLKYYSMHVLCPHILIFGCHKLPSAPTKNKTIKSTLKGNCIPILYGCPISVEGKFKMSIKAINFPSACYIYREIAAKSLLLPAPVLSCTVM